MRECVRLCLCAGLLLAAGCHNAVPPGHMSVHRTTARQAAPSGDPLARISPPRNAADRIVNRAKDEARHGVVYDASYRSLAYPGGDVPADRGACTDVVVRSLRAAGVDLQQRIHEDMARRYDRYPHNWAVRHPDANIDHRRGANHIAYFRRHAKSLPTDATGAGAATWQPGDIVYWKLGSSLDHCGVISDVRNPQGVPLVIHNIGIARQEDCLTAWKIVAHFRYPAQ